MTVQPSTDRRGGVLDSKAFRIGVVVAIVLAIVVGLLAAVYVANRPAEPPTPTVWANITSGIEGDGDVPAVVALQAFELAFKVDVPGVELPSGRSSDDVPTTATGILRWIDAKWDDLTPEQQAAVTPYTTVQPDRVTADAVAGRVASVEAWPGPPPRAAPPAPVDLCNRPLDLNGAAPPALVKALHDDLTANLARLGSRLGLPPIGASGMTLAFSAENGGNTLMQTKSLHGGLCSFSPCNVTVYANTWQGQQALTPQLHVLLTHEAVHCYQNQTIGQGSAHEQMPPWIMEGGALWLAADDTQQLETMVPSQWRNGWFAEPDRPLTVRSYDAFGYYSLLSHLGRPLWSLMPTGWAALAGAAGGTSRSEPFIAVLTGDAQDVRSAWAPSFLRQDAWGDPWITHGLGLEPDMQAFRFSLFAGRAPGYVGQVESRANVIRSVTGGDGEIIRIEGHDGALASVHDEQGHGSVAFESDRFCISGDCVCPPGTERAGEKLADKEMKVPFALAVNGPPGGATYEVEALSLEDECVRRATPRPSGPPCEESCASSNGDPHLTMVDGGSYDFQAAGEFVLLRSPEGDVEIQARQEPYGDEDFVSINTGLATRVGDHRVGVYETADGLEVRVDGAISAEATIDLGGGGSLRVLAGGVEMALPDGTVVWALDTDGYGINAVIAPSDALRDAGTGILGPAVENGVGFPAMPDGSALDVPFETEGRHEALYVTFADAWRVTDATTLFDYEGTAGPDTFDIAGFPALGASMTLEDLDADARARGEAACSAITEPALHDQCVFDVAVTGDPTFAAGYDTTQGFLAEGTAVIEVGRPTTEPTPTATTEPTPGPEDTEPLISGFSELRSAALGPDGTVYLALEEADGTFQVAAADPRANRVIATADGVGAGQVAVAGGGVWSAAGEGIDDCSISRLEPADLAVVTTIEIPCFGFVPTQLVVLGDAVWYAEPTGGGADGSQPRLRRIDPATNEPDDGITLPSGGGTLRYGADAVFFLDQSSTWHRLQVGESGFTALGSVPLDALPAGADLAAGDLAGTRADIFSAAGGPQSSLPVGGRLVGGDAGNLYVEHGQDPPDFVPVLYRYPRDGSTPTILMGPMSVEIDGSEYNFAYNDPSTLLLGDDDAVKVFTFPRGLGDTLLFVRIVDLP